MQKLKSNLDRTNDVLDRVNAHQKRIEQLMKQMMIDVCYRTFKFNDVSGYFVTRIFYCFFVLLKKKLITIGSTKSMINPGFLGMGF